MIGLMRDKLKRTQTDLKDSNCASMPPSKLPLPQNPTTPPSTALAPSALLVPPTISSRHPKAKRSSTRLRTP